MLRNCAGFFNEASNLILTSAIEVDIHLIKYVGMGAFGDHL
jgi:hypothetical protein